MLYGLDWDLIEDDPVTGRKVWTKIEDGERIIEVTYPVDHILKANHDARMDAPAKHGDWSRIASVPLGFHFQHMAEAVSQQDTKYVDKVLGEFSKFKTR